MLLLRFINSLHEQRICLAGPTRLELATSGVTGRRSDQLNYDPAKGVVDYRTKVWWLAMYAGIPRIISSGEGRLPVYYICSR